MTIASIPAEIYPQLFLANHHLPYTDKKSEHLIRLIMTVSCVSKSIYEKINQTSFISNVPNYLSDKLKEICAKNISDWRKAISQMIIDWHSRSLDLTWSRREMGNYTCRWAHFNTEKNELIIYSLNQDKTNLTREIPFSPNPKKCSISKIVPSEPFGETSCFPQSVSSDNWVAFLKNASTVIIMSDSFDHYHSLNFQLSTVYQIKIKDNSLFLLVKENSIYQFMLYDLNQPNASPSIIQLPHPQFFNYSYQFHLVEDGIPFLCKGDNHRVFTKLNSVHFTLTEFQTAPTFSVKDLEFHFYVDNFTVKDNVLYFAELTNGFLKIRKQSLEKNEQEQLIFKDPASVLFNIRFSPNVTINSIKYHMNQIWIFLSNNYIFVYDLKLKKTDYWGFKFSSCGVEKNFTISQLDFDPSSSSYLSPLKIYCSIMLDSAQDREYKILTIKHLTEAALQ